MSVRAQPARLLPLGAELVQVGRPVRATRRVRRARAVPAADAGDGLLAVLVLVDHVPQGLGLAGAIRGTGQRQRSTVQGCELLGTGPLGARFAQVRGRELSPIPTIFADRPVTT